MKKLFGLIVDPRRSSIGLFGYAAISILFGVRFDWGVAVFALVVPYFLLDVVSFGLYLILRHGFGMRRLTSHWALTHHPLLVTPLMGWLGWAVGEWLGVSHWYTAVLSAALVFFHFVDETKYAVGLHWFSPFRWERLSLAGGLHVVDPALVEQNYRRVEGWRGQDDVSERAALSVEHSLTDWQIIFFIVSITLFVVYLFAS